MAKIGAQLKAAREGRGETLSEAAQATRIKVQQLEGMEQDDFSTIPAPTYIKGFIRLYARHLALDPEELVQCYLEEASAEEASPPLGLQVQVLEQPDEPPEEVQVAPAEPVSDPAPPPEAPSPGDQGDLFSAPAASGTGSEPVKPPAKAEAVVSDKPVAAPRPATPAAAPVAATPRGPGGLPGVAPGTPRLTAAGTQDEPPRPLAEVLPVFVKTGAVLIIVLIGFFVVRSCRGEDPDDGPGIGEDVSPVVSGAPLVDGPVLIEAPGEPFVD